MSLVFKENKPIIGRNCSTYNFGKLTGDFIINVLEGDIEFEVFVDNLKIDTTSKISLKDQNLELRPVKDNGGYIFRLSSAITLPDTLRLDTNLMSGVYYDIKQIDCNFKLTVNTSTSARLYIKCNGIVLVDTDTLSCEVSWPALGDTTIIVTSIDGTTIPILLEKV